MVFSTVVRFDRSVASETATPFYVKKQPLPDSAGEYPAMKEFKLGFSVPIPFKPGERAKLDTGEHLIAVLIEMTYDDGFGQQRSHVFCYHTSPNAPKGWKVCGGQLTPNYLRSLAETK